METPEIKVNVEGSDLVIRTGDASPIKLPREVQIVGTIEAPANYLEPRSAEELAQFVNGNKSTLFVDYDAKSLFLDLNETSPFRCTVTGKLVKSKEYEAIMVSDKTPLDLANLIKMNRTFFESKDEAMALVTLLKNFKAKIDGEMQKVSDDRGNYDYRRSQVVESNLPKGFVLCIPLFKGMAKAKFYAEIYVDPASLNCSILSPDANDMMEETTREIIDGVVARVTKRIPAVAVIYK